MSRREDEARLLAGPAAAAVSSGSRICTRRAGFAISVAKLSAKRLDSTNLASERPPCARPDSCNAPVADLSTPMDFRQIATKEASALVASVADRLASLAAAELERHTQRLQKDIDAAVAARSQAESALAAAREELAGATARREELATALERARERMTAMEAALEESERARERAVVNASAAAAETSELRRTIEALRKEQAEALAESAAQLADSTARFQALEQSLAESEALRVEQARVAREQLALAVRLPLDRLRAAFARFNTVTSVQATLEVLVDALATEFGRVALFHVAGNKLQGTRQSGFDAATDVSKLVVPLGMESVLTDAVRTRRVCGLTGGELEKGSRSLFGGAPSFALAVPIEVRGNVVAVIYADDSDQAPTEGSTSDRRVKFTEVLLWHAVPLMNRLAADEEELAEFRKYAVGLLRDLESVYTTESTSGYAERELRVRLRHNLDYARRMYAQSIEPDDRAAAALLDEAIAALVAERYDTPFGRDLAEVAGIEMPTGATAPAAPGKQPAARTR